MGIARVVVGTFFCLVISTLILFFINLAFPLVEYATFGTTNDFLVTFGQIISPFTIFKVGHWWVVIAVIIGALFGGFIAKSPTAGVGTGIVSCFLCFILFISLTIGFNFGAWTAWVSFWDGNIGADVVLCFILFIVLGAIGGKITAEND
ncbi:MAG: hypothetical protein ACTSRS_18445 [Candidatus Helarchaeota archaeon]